MVQAPDLPAFPLCQVSNLEKVHDCVEIGPLINLNVALNRFYVTLHASLHERRDNAFS